MPTEGCYYLQRAILRLKLKTSEILSDRLDSHCALTHNGTRPALDRLEINKKHDTDCNNNNTVETQRG